MILKVKVVWGLHTKAFWNGSSSFREKSRCVIYLKHFLLLGEMILKMFLKNNLLQKVWTLFLWSFLGIASLVFSEIWKVARNSYEVVHDRARFSGKKFFAPKLRKKAQNGPKTGFFQLLEDLVITFYWIWSIMEIYIICCVPAQIPYLGKFLFLRYGPKCSQPMRLHDFLIDHISRTNLWNSLIFLHVDTNLHKLKVDQKIFGWAWPEMVVTSLVTGL